MSNQISAVVSFDVGQSLGSRMTTPQKTLFSNTIMCYMKHAFQSLMDGI